jgi:uncharacterized membrane protein
MKYLKSKNMDKQDAKAWIIAIAILAVAITIGHFFGLELEKTIW